MPNTPWAFVYRDSVEVMQSHLKNYGLLNTKPNCLRMYGAKDQAAILQQVVSKADRTIDSLTGEEYCAAHLVSNMCWLVFDIGGDYSL